MIIKDTLDKLGISENDKSQILIGYQIGLPADTITRLTLNAVNKNLTEKANKQRKYYMKNATKTEKKIHSMLIESTGCDSMDSGGDNSRHWQKNRKIKDMRKNKDLTWSSRKNSDYIESSVDVFNWLNNNVEYTNEAEELTKQFYLFCRKKTDGYYALMHDWINEQTELENIETNQKECYNTYNDSSLLSQDIQYFTFEKNNKSFVLMQIHNGADVRGGYTKPVIFETFDMFYPYPSIFLKCDCKEHDSEYNLHKEWKVKSNDKIICSDCDQLVEVFVN